MAEAYTPEHEHESSLNISPLMSILIIGYDTFAVQPSHRSVILSGFSHHTAVMLLLLLYKLQHAFFDHVHCVVYISCIDVAICLTNNSICLCIQYTS